MRIVQTLSKYHLGPRLHNEWKVFWGPKPCWEKANCCLRYSSTVCRRFGAVWASCKMTTEQTAQPTTTQLKNHFNTATRIVTLIKEREYIKTVTKNLQRLPVKERLDHSAFFTVGQLLQWLNSNIFFQKLIHRYDPAQSLRLTSQSRLRISSVDENRTKEQFRFRAFSNSARLDIGKPSCRH